VRRAIGRAQCNDAYWHGVFGGLYLPHLRAAIWRELAAAERALRQDEGTGVEALDLDADGEHELWIHSPRQSAIIAPARGGAIEVLLDLERGINLCDVVARHPEAYHSLPDPAATPTGEGGAVPAPPVDHERRGLLMDRFIAGTAQREDFVQGTVPMLRSLTGTRLMESWDVRPDRVEVRLGMPGFHKVIRMEPGGTVHCDWEWDAGFAGDGGGWFSTELSCSAPVSLSAGGAERWEYPVETVARSERGLDRTTQGQAVVLAWPISARRASVTVALDRSR
jgi:alpha-amylase